MQKIMIAQEIQKQAGGIEITDQGLHHRRVGFPQRPEDRRDILSLQRGYGGSACENLADSAGVPAVVPVPSKHSDGSRPSPWCVH